MELEVNETNNGGLVNISVGDVLDVVLASNPSTGYTWRQITSPSHLSLEEHSYEASLPVIVGSGGYDHWRFLGVSAGSDVVTLGYYAAGATTPTSTFSVTVTVSAATTPSQTTTIDLNAIINLMMIMMVMKMMMGSMKELT